MTDERQSEPPAVVLNRELIAGVSILVVSSLLAAVLFPPSEPAGRAVVLAVACGLVVATATEWRAVAGVAAATVLAFAVELTPDNAGFAAGTSWCSYTPLIGFVVLVGRGCPVASRLRPHPNAGLVERLILLSAVGWLPCPDHGSPAPARTSDSRPRRSG